MVNQNSGVLLQPISSILADGHLAVSQDWAELQKLEQATRKGKVKCRADVYNPAEKFQNRVVRGK